jgi:tellurite resistance protein
MVDGVSLRRHEELVRRPAVGLEHFPVTLFSSVMGIGGLSLAWRRAARVWDVPAWPAQALFWTALAVFVVVATLYALKWVQHPAAARAELRHPIRMTFVPTVTIALLVLAIAGQDLVTGAARVAWWVGTLGQLTLTVLVLSAWFGRADIAMGQMTPAWFIPIVGNVVSPLAADQIGSVELAWFAFAVGMVFWVALLPLLLHRLLLHEAPMPTKLLPTLAILIAPPAVAALSWQSLTGRIDDPLGRVLFAAAMMFTVLLVAQIGRLRAVPFALPYWAYSFPFAAATVAAIAMAGARPSPVYDVIGAVLLTVTTVVVAAVATLTLRAAARGEILAPE